MPCVCQSTAARLIELSANSIPDVPWVVTCCAFTPDGIGRGTVPVFRSICCRRLRICEDCLGKESRKSRRSFSEAFPVACTTGLGISTTEKVFPPLHCSDVFAGDDDD